MQSVYLGYGEDIRVRGYGGEREIRETEKRREEMGEEKAETVSSEGQRENEGGDISLPLCVYGGRETGSGWCLSLKGTEYPGDRVGQHNYNCNTYHKKLLIKHL